MDTDRNLPEKVEGLLLDGKPLWEREEICISMFIGW